MSGPVDWDVKTTPPWLRIPALLFLGVVILYLLSCFHFTLQPSPPGWVVAGYWQMFSVRDRGSADVAAEALIAGEWVDLSLPELFPTRWESGYRWSRSSFRRSKSRMRVLAGAACKRHPGDVQRVRITQHSWGKILGSLERKDESSKVLIDHDCRALVRLPGGRTQ